MYTRVMNPAHEPHNDTTLLPFTNNRSPMTMASSKMKR